ERLRQVGPVCPSAVSPGDCPPVCPWARSLAVSWVGQVRSVSPCSPLSGEWHHSPLTPHLIIIPAPVIDLAGPTTNPLGPSRLPAGRAAVIIVVVVLHALVPVLIFVLVFVFVLIFVLFLVKNALFGLGDLGGQLGRLGGTQQHLLLGTQAVFPQLEQALVQKE